MSQLYRLNEMLSSLVRHGASFLERPSQGATNPDDLIALCRKLLTTEGEPSGMVLAAQILNGYLAAPQDDRVAFFGLLATEFDLDPAPLRAALDAHEAENTTETLAALIAAAEPPRQDLFRRLNTAPGGTARIVDMRRDLLAASRQNHDLRRVDADLRHLLMSWFNRGFLILQSIDWGTSAEVLEKIIAYEAVHQIASWDDLRRRLQPADRRCFGFFHPALPREPLIFVEVALTRGIPGSIGGLLAEDRAAIAADEADTAVFYSISNCQDGLKGISFGNSLIKQVVEDLSRDLPGLKTFVTLSPIPGLRRWLDQTGRVVPDDQPQLFQQMAALYLLEARRGDGSPADPVARFHLGNGAQIHAVHSGADLSENGLAQSGGAMVNYLYNLPRISRNLEAFITKGSIAASSEVRALATEARRRDAQKAPAAKAADKDGG
jgi:malonyl-CoA decarboxylase